MLWYLGVRGSSNKCSICNTTMLYCITISAFSIVIFDVGCVMGYNETFAIVTNGCIIPGAPGESELIKQLSRPIPVEKCDHENYLLDSNSTHIRILKDALDLFNIVNENEFYCCYYNFLAHENIRNIQFGHCTTFKTVIKATDEFVKVACFYLDSEIYTDYFVFPPKEVKVERKFNNSTFNVIVLGMEGISRLNFERMMPKTAKYLKSRGAVQLRGYNKVGDNSYPNLFPLLTGKSFKMYKGDASGMIWNLYKRAGFHTALGSDSAVGVLSEYEFQFPTLPADYYLQPFMNEARNILKNPEFVYEHQCLRNKLFYKILLNYIKNLTNSLKSNRLFGFFWEESVTHDSINKPQMMDKGYLQFVKELDQEKYLENTILIFLSDHGIRWGEFVETRQGHLEARLPILTILFPTSFKKKYKYAFNNFKMNSNRLTTPYDIYETLADLVDPSSLKKSDLIRKNKIRNRGEQGKSLFLPISGKRTCAQLGIEPIWCACSAGVPLAARARPSAKAARMLVNHINDLLRNYAQCHKLRLKKLLAVTELKDASGNSRTYTATVRTAPGGALFEGVVRREGSSWAAGEDVARLNTYRNQSYCVENSIIKLYCFCSR